MSSHDSSRIKIDRSRDHAARVPDDGRQQRVFESSEVLPDDQYPGMSTLQQSLGNRVVSEVLTSASSSTLPATAAVPGASLPDSLRLPMEAAFGHDFSNVRLHTDITSARTAQVMNAAAFTQGAEITFAPGRFQPATREGQMLIAHELAHVVQQERGGSAPVIDRDAPHERDARTAAESALSGGNATVTTSTGVGIAQSPEDWLRGTPNIQDEQQWPFTALQDELDDLDYWLGPKIANTPDVVRITEARDMVIAEIQRRAKRIAPPPAKRGRSRKKGAKKGAKADTAANDEEILERPRILVERRTVHYTDPAEVRREVDLIMAWLRLENIPREERAILLNELQNLAPQIDQQREKVAAEAHSQRIQQALTPQISGDHRRKLVETVRLISAIRPLPENPEISYIMFGEDMILLHTEQADEIRKGVQKVLVEGAGKVKTVRDDAHRKWKGQAEVNEEFVVTSWVVSLFTGNDAADIHNKMLPFMSASLNYLAQFDRAAKRGDLVAMAESLTQAEAAASTALRIASNWVDDIISTSETIVTVLEVTRDVSFAISTSYFGGAGFLALKGTMGVARAGLTVTALGSAGTGLARGGGTLIGEAATGDVNWGNVGGETVAGLKQGAVNTTTAVVTGGTSAALGRGTTFVDRSLRTGLAGTAGGSAGGFTEAVLEGKAPGEIAERTVKSGVGGGIGGLFGGANLPGKVGIKNAVVGSTLDMAGGGLGALASGGSKEDAIRAAAISFATGRATTSAKPPKSGGQRTEAPKKSATGKNISEGKPEAATPKVVTEPSSAKGSLVPETTPQTPPVKSAPGEPTSAAGQAPRTTQPETKQQTTLAPGVIRRRPSPQKSTDADVVLDRPLRDPPETSGPKSPPMKRSSLEPATYTSTRKTITRQPVPKPEVTYGRGSRPPESLAPQDIGSIKRAQEARDRAIEKWSELPKSKQKKTTAAGESGSESVSGQQPGSTGLSPQKVAEQAKEFGHKLAPHARDPKNRPGEYHAGHAEKKVGGTARGVSREVCNDCIAYFKRMAATKRENVTVADPNCTRVFEPNGQYTEYWDNGAVVRFRPDGTVTAAPALKD